MKLRIKGNSVRLRLQRNEISTLSETGRVSETLSLGPLPDIVLRYTLETNSGDNLELRGGGGGLTISLPDKWAKSLVGTDRVGYDASVETVPGIFVRVVIEKDFQCLVERPGDDDSDSFINPDTSSCRPAPRIHEYVSGPRD